MNKRYSHNFSYMAAYTWSHNFDDSTATNFSTILSPRRAQDFQNMRAEWASSALDRRHRFTLRPMLRLQAIPEGQLPDAEERRRQLEHLRDLHLPVAGICYRAERGRFQPE